jgi:hypothetical protein
MQCRCRAGLVRPFLLTAIAAAVGWALPALAQPLKVPAAQPLNAPATQAIDVAAAPDSTASTEPANEWGWQLPPVRTSGSLSYDLRASRAQGEGSSVQHMLTANLGGASYIYQPWLATVSAAMGLTTSRTRDNTRSLTHNGNDIPGDSAGTRTGEERFVTGSARLDLFPRSRFPFDLHYERTDSRIDSGLASTLDYQAQNIGVTQRYRPPSGAYAINASFDRRQQSGAGVDDTQSLFAGDFTTGWGHNDLSLSASQSRSARRVSDEHAMFRSVVGRHHFAPDNHLSLDTTVNASQNDDGLIGLRNEVSVWQWSSIGLWRDEEGKLTLSGALRGLRLTQARTDQPLDSFGATLGAAYELNHNTRLTASGTVNNLQSAGTRSRSLLGSLGVSWQADTREFEGLRYDSYANATVGGARAGSERQTTAAMQLGHSLGRSWLPSEAANLNLTVSQSLNSTRNHSSGATGVVSEGDNAAGNAFLRAPEVSSTLVHSAAATWTSSGNANGSNSNSNNNGNSNAYARAAFSDASELGGGRSRFQMFNFQVSGNFEFDRQRSLSGDLTFQRVRQRAAQLHRVGADGSTLPAERFGSDVLSGEISYRQQKLFGVPRLRFVSRLKLAQDVLTQAGTLAALPDRESRFWENRLEWVAGRLETQLVLRIAEFDGVRRESLMWRLQRSFGE